MCLLMLAWRAHPRYALVVAANRDEYHERPAAPLAVWPPPTGLLGGRDLQAHGTWLALDRTRRFGVVTNYRERERPLAGAPSRGELVPRYLGARDSAQQFLATLEPRAPSYGGFNLLITHGDALWYASNRARPFARALPPGVYGLANEQLDTPWPKLERVRAGFKAWLREPAPQAAALFTLLADRTPAPDNALPGPGGGLPAEWARALSAPFVVNPQYGTRCSTVVLLEPDARLYVAEHRFDPGGTKRGTSEFSLGAGDWP